MTDDPLATKFQDQDPPAPPDTPTPATGPADDDDLLAYLDVPAKAPELPPPPKLEFDVDLPEVNPESDLAVELSSLRPLRPEQAAAPEKDEGPDRHLPTFQVALSEQQLAEQLRPGFEAAHPSEGSLDELAGPKPAPTEPETKVIQIDDTPREAPARPPSRPRRLLRRLADIWNGPLGWSEQAQPSAAFVTAKLALRVALFGVVPIGLALAVGFASIGAAYASHPPVAGDPALLWARGVIDFQAPDQLIQIDDGTSVSGRLLDQLSSIYDNAWTDISSAVDSGNTSVLSGALSGSALDTYQSRAADAHAHGWQLQLYGPGQSRDQLLFLTASPASDPGVITAQDGFISIYLTDASGKTVSSADYSGVEATFVRDAAGVWRLDMIAFDPL
jgi:hypothetical protein